MDSKSLNGVDVNKLQETIKAIKDDHELAIFKFRATNQWEKGSKSVTTIKDFYGAKQMDSSRQSPFKMGADEPEVLLGTNLAPNATEATLHALASCMATTVVYQAAAQGIKIEDLEIELEGELDLRGFLGLSKEVRSGFKNINITYKINADASDEKIRELCEASQKQSPVYDIITNAVPVNTTIETNASGLDTSSKAA